MKKAEQSPYDEGVKAYRRGESVHACPYPADSDDAREWAFGWHCTHLDALEFIGGRI